MKDGVLFSSTAGLLRFFEYDHLPIEAHTMAATCKDVALKVVAACPDKDSASLQRGLSKLLEARDEFACAL